MDLIKKFNLPNYIRGKSFAEASKLIDEKIRDKGTKEEMMQRLADYQEYQKQQEILDEYF